MRIESLITGQESKLLKEAGLAGDERKLREEIEARRRIEEKKRLRELEEKERRLREEKQREWEVILASVGGNVAQAQLIWDLRREDKLDVGHVRRTSSTGIRELSQRAANRQGG